MASNSFSIASAILMEGTILPILYYHRRLFRYQFKILYSAVTSIEDNNKENALVWERKKSI
jgi:hypothetical protein